jgi:eukaryotic-like serine/threonine-protein kinase
MSSMERRVFGKYHVLARLGRGGMGDVFLVVNLGPSGVSKLVVIKELRERLARMPEARSMFMDEARVATRLNHPNVVQTYEVIEEVDSFYLTMEYLEGQSLQSIIRGPKSELVPLVLKLQVLAQTLAALHYAHELTDYDGTPLNIVHRDVSPHNVIVTYGGTAKLLDFGIAKAADATTVTESGVFKGKVRFSAPEQIVGTDIDRRADVFAAGVMLWEILAGEQMWKGVPDTKIFVELAGGRIPGPRSVCDSVPETLNAICCKAIAFDRHERFATAKEFREALLEYIREVGEPSVELGAILASAFGTERREMRAVVDAEIKAVREASTDAIRMRRVPALSVPPADGSGSRATALSHAQTSNTGPGRRRPGPRGRVIVPGALVAASCLAALIYATFPGRPAQSTLTAAVSASATLPAPAPSARLGAPIHLHLSAQPASTRFVIDGVPAAANPYDGDFSNDGANHTIAAQADGFDSREIQTRFDRDVFFDVTLPAAAPIPPVASIAPSTAPARSMRVPRWSPINQARPIAPSPQAQKAPRPVTEADEDAAKK